MTDNYQGYAPDPQATNDQIRLWFLAKYGYLPEKVIRSRAAVLAGPIHHKERENGE